MVMLQNPAMQDAIAASIIKQLGLGSKEFGQKHDATGTPAATGYVHGPGGLLTFPGVDPDVFHTIIGPLPGIMSRIPTMASVFTDPTYFTLTGMQADSGGEKDAVCDDAPTGGLQKGGKLWAPFGRYSRQTREIDITRLGQRNDPSDPIDLRLMGSPIGGDLFGGLADMGFGSDALVSEVATIFRERAVSFHRLLSRQAWIGDPANNSAGGGSKEFPGLELLVNTGHVDAESNTSLPSLDSDLKNFNYGAVQDSGGALVDAITAMARYVKSIASRTGVMPVRWEFFLRESLFYELTKVWPCSYYLGGCTVVDADGQRVTIDARDQIELRDQMRTGQFLLIDGIRYDVSFDDGITELNGANSGGNFPAGCFASDIFLLPMSVMGGRSVLFLEHFQFSNPQITEILGRQVLARVGGGGAFIDIPSQTRNCVTWLAEIMPRIVLRTPWLAARLQNVVYCPTQHTRDVFPDDPYFVNGGATTRSGPSYYAGFKS
jgi:hypothetical protein